MKDKDLNPLRTAYRILHPHSDWLPLSWNALNNADWRKLLSDHPEFAPYCPWHRLDGYSWSTILMAQPQFADKCKWSRLKSQHWPLLLLQHPEFADKCPWPERIPLDRSFLMSDHPQFADKCDWSKMRATPEWSLCDFWTHLFKTQPQFLERLDMDSLDIASCVALLLRHPDVAARFKRWDEIGTNIWAREILPYHPQFADKCHCWDRFDGEAWSMILQWQPQFLSKCNLAEIGPDKWCQILGAMPQLADECKCWEDFAGCHWAALLGRRPEFAERCHHWERLGAKDWVDLLLRQPQFEDRCDKWNKISRRDWWRILEWTPKFLAKCEVEPRWTGDEWPSQWIPSRWPGHHDPRLALPLADKYDWWSRLDGKMWSRLLKDRPKLADRCDWTKLRNRDWFNLLDGPHDPGFAAHCPETVFAYWRKRGFAFKGATHKRAHHDSGSTLTGETTEGVMDGPA